MSGVGRIYRRHKIWWLAYYKHGREHRESAHTQVESEAKRLLRAKLTAASLPREDRVTFEDLVSLVLTDYEAKGRRSLYDVEKSRVPKLRDFFAGERAVDITASRVRLYVAERRREKAAPATINRELSVLRRAFRLALQDRTLSAAPYISLLPERNTRTGFVTSEQFEAIRKELPAALRDVARFLYLTGWRVSEALTLEWRDVDLGGLPVADVERRWSSQGLQRKPENGEGPGSCHGRPPSRRPLAGSITLRDERSKSGKGRVLPLGFELSELIKCAESQRDLACSNVFHRNGHPLLRWHFSKLWRKAATAAGLGGILVHDLRRSAARNMVRAGVPERVAMAMTGHKTRSTFDRYNIVSPTDLEQAQAKVSAYLGGAPDKTATVRVLRKQGEKGNGETARHK